MISAGRVTEEIMCFWTDILGALVPLVRREGGWGRMSPSRRRDGGDEVSEVSAKYRFLQRGLWVADSFWKVA